MLVVPLEPQPLKNDDVAKAQLFTPIHAPGGVDDDTFVGVAVDVDTIVGVGSGCAGATVVGVISGALLGVDVVVGRTDEV